jgi:hypothetical protein
MGAWSHCANVTDTEFYGTNIDVAVATVAIR